MSALGNKARVTRLNAASRRAREGAAAKVVSLIVPVFNEQDAIVPFLERVDAVFSGLAPRYTLEVVFVNDGSRDASEFVIRSRMQSDLRIRLVNLSRNFGKEAALSAGFDHATGDACIPMDVDLQDPPELIPRMLDLWAGGARIVNARRSERRSDGWAKRVTALGFYRVFNAIAEHPIPADVGDFRLLDRQVVDVIGEMGERVRFNKALFSWVGFDCAEVEYERPARTAGSSRWSFWKLWNFALDGIFSASTTPLRVWTYFGGALAVLSILYAAFILLRTLIVGIDVPGYASTVILILIFGGLNLFAIGILGEYVGRIYSEVRERPLYVVRSVHDTREDD